MGFFLRNFFTKINQISFLTNQNSLIKPLAPRALLKHCQKTFSNAPTPFEVVDVKHALGLENAVLNKVNTLIEKGSEGRLFAVVHVAGKQFKITQGDIIVIEGYWPPNVGDKLTLDKVLLAGGVDFSLIGKPVVQKGLVRVEAVVIEKTLSHTKTNLKKKRRKQYMRINFYRIPQTYLRVSAIEIIGKVGNPPEVRGLETTIF